MHINSSTYYLKNMDTLSFFRPPFTRLRVSITANLLSPVIEEIVIRGLIQSTVKNTALLAMNHFAASGIGIAVTTYLSVVLQLNRRHSRDINNFIAVNQLVNGIFFGLAMEMTGGLITPISLHFFHNLINVELIDSRTNLEVIFLDDGLIRTV